MPTPARGPAEPTPNRARPGTIARPISGRLYRLAWLVVVVPVAILALSVTEPSPLPESSLPESFNGPSALSVAETFSSLFPDRVPGTLSAQQAAAWVADQMAATGLTVERRPFRAELPGGGTPEHINVIGTLPPRASGRSSKTIVVVAHRDNRGLSPGTNDNATGTAVLLQIARQVGTTALDHTLVFASVDGGASGNAGALELAREGTRPDSLFSPSRSLAVVNLDSLGTRGAPRLVFGGNGAAFASPVLVATADARVVRRDRLACANAVRVRSLQARATRCSGHPDRRGAAGRVWPFGADNHYRRMTSPMSQTDLERARTSSTSPRSTLPGRRPPSSSSARWTAAADVASGTDAYVYLGGRALRGWAIALTLLAALLPVLASNSRPARTLPPSQTAGRSLGFEAFGPVRALSHRLAGGCRLSARRHRNNSQCGSSSSAALAPDIRGSDDRLGASAALVSNRDPRASSPMRSPGCACRRRGQEVDAGRRSSPATLRQ